MASLSSKCNTCQNTKIKIQCVVAYHPYDVVSHFLYLWYNGVVSETWLCYYIVPGLAKS